MTTREITAALRGQWHGSYGMCRCPAHDDRTPSMKVWDGANGDVLCHCFAGCSWEAVKDALRGQGLLPERTCRGGAAPPPQPDPALVAKREAEQRANEQHRVAQARANSRSLRPWRFHDHSARAQMLKPLVSSPCVAHAIMP